MLGAPTVYASKSYDRRTWRFASRPECARGARVGSQQALLAAEHTFSLSARCSASKNTDDRQQRDSADERHKQSRQAEIALVDCADMQQRRQYVAGQECADNANHDIEQQALTLPHQLAGYPTNNRPTISQTMKLIILSSPV